MDNELGSAEAQDHSGGEPDFGLFAIAVVAGHYRIAADPAQLNHDLGLGGRASTSKDLARAAIRLGLKARVVPKASLARVRAAPMPCIIGMKDGTFRVVIGWNTTDDKARLGNPVTRGVEDVSPSILSELWTGELILLTRRYGGKGIDPGLFGFRWFLPPMWRYRWPLSQFFLASLVVQIFALASPLLFQLVIDKVLVHKGYSTLTLVAIGMVGIAMFDSMMQISRTYLLTHTTSRIDVELGARLFDHLLRLPLQYFESRATGQTVARVHELETIRSFITGQGLSSLLDLLFAVIFVAVLSLYSVKLTLITLLSVPAYLAINFLIRPVLREKVNQRFNAGAASQQLLVETIVGIETLKAAAVEPVLRNDWEDRLAAYVRASFLAVVWSAVGQNAIGFISRVTNAAVLFFGAQAVLDNELTLGGLIAFNMILTQAVAPVLRLAQLWQDFQQVRISVERLGDILNTPAEAQRLSSPSFPAAKGEIKLSDLRFRYYPQSPEVIRGLSLDIPAGQMIGLFGPSGSGKSTLTKLIQRFYQFESGKIFIDGIDIQQADTAWLRRQIGVVLQENMLFNRTIHENIALANPRMHRSMVIRLAKIAGADDFINQLPMNYDYKVEERGANLSGGQRQRIAIARALATDPRILIMDEATSALDYESERAIRLNMRQIAQGRTVIIIAHRLSALRDCSRLYGMINGEIVEQGGPLELLNNSASLYSRLWRMQMEADANPGFVNKRAPASQET